MKKENQININSIETKSLLAVMAHPDDETFGMGGTLALYAQQGVRVHLICATRGEAGDVERVLLQNSHSIADYRESELRCAANKLGLSSIHFLDYRDSGMPGTGDNHHPDALMGAPVEEVATKIVRLIEQIKPQVIITFDPIGGYNHPDHIAIHKATVRAFELSRNGTNKLEGNYSPAKLYFQTIQRKFLRPAVRLMSLFGRDPRHFGKNKDIDLLAITEVNFPIHAKINYHHAGSLRDQASACYVSQGGIQMTQGPLALWRRLFSNYDTFIRYYPPPQTNYIERDLFEGIETSSSLGI